MDKFKIIYIESSLSETCFLTEEQLKHYGLSDKTPDITITFGSLSITLRRSSLNEESHDIHKLYLSKDVEELIYIPEGTVLQVRQMDDSHLELGPLIGVFINQEKMNYLIGGKGITAYTHFDVACRKMLGLCCFFSIEGIDWNNKLVRGLYRKKPQWISVTFPLPKVIYDRNVENNCRVESMELRNRLGSGYRILNCMPKLSKWETIIALRKNPMLRSAIPETIQYKSCRDVAASLQRHPCIYLKPDSLSKGKGVFRITKASGCQYKVEYRTPEKNHIVNLNTLNVLDDLMKDYSIKGGGYIIQQEIEKASFRENPFDFRLLYQKNYKGEWEPGGIAGRISAPGSIITSPRSGGAVENFSTILKETFNEDPSTEGGLYKEVIRIGKEICSTIEQEFGDCVELGLDMTIDINHRIWVIEVNGKPLKVSLKRLNQPELVARCNRRPIEYAVYRSGFRSIDTSIYNNL